MNNYLFCTDASRLKAVIGQFDALLKNHRLIAGWLQFYDGCYLLRSPVESAKELMETFDGFFDESDFVIARIGRSNVEIDGREAEEFWSFIKDSVKSDA